MKGLRLMSNGRWNKPPVLMAARHILMQAIQRRGPTGSLGSLAEFVNGTSYEPGKLCDDGLPIIRISNISDPSSPYLRTNEAFEPRFIARKGDLLVSWSASFKSILWPGPEGVVNQHIFKVTPVGNNDRSFIRHAIEAAFDGMQEKTVGIGMMHLRRSDFLGQEVAAPDRPTQVAVAAYLDWVEGGCRGAEPPLPPPLAEQRRIVARLDAVETRVCEARSLRSEVRTDVSRVVVSLHNRFAVGEPKRADELLQLDEDRVPVQPGMEYPQVGVRGFGGGLFASGVVSAESTTYRAFNRLHAGMILLSQVKGWEGAIAGVSKAFDGFYASPEYRTYRCRADRLLPDYAAAIVRTPWFHAKLSTLTRGVGARRERLRPEMFASLRLAVPTPEDQHRLAGIFRDLESATGDVSRTDDSITALTRHALARAFSGTL